MNTPEQLGPYRIEELLGKGGMGRVYRATHAETGAPVAIKSLSPQLAMNDGFIERFRAEIESLRLLKHAAIVRLLGYGQEEGTHFYAMELVEGPSLEDELRQGRRFDWREVTDIGAQLCRALKHAHDHGVIHRDIKPANILLAPSGKVKLADFGISRLFGGDHLTLAGGVIGTADYMAPEQVSGEGVTPRCDQYCLGGVMYALLAGRPPFVAKSFPEMLQLQRYAEPEPLSRFASETPRPLEAAVMQMLSKEPEQRFPNTLVLAKHLEAMRIALSRPIEQHLEQPEEPNDGIAPGDAPPPANPNSNGATRGYDSPTEMMGSEQTGSIILVDDDDATPAAPARATGREPHAAPTVAAGDSSALPSEPKPSLFTEVAAETPTGPSASLSAVTQAAIGVALASLACWMAWSLLAPPNADTLHATIERTIEPGDAAALRAAADNVAAFLNRFPDDPRAAPLREVQRAIETDRRERQLSTKLLANRLRLRGGAAADASPLEQLYLAALQRSKTSPERAVEDLRALAVLIKNEAASNAKITAGADKTRGLADVVHREIERLQTAAAEERATHLPLLKAQVRQAQAIAADQPEEAKKICRAVITLYGDRPWAAAFVEEARNLAERR